ncbi:unnamed protein product, partial [Closterium sp. NIES-54]
DHFLSLCPTELTVDLLEERLTAAEKSILAVGASRGDPRAAFFEGCSPVPLLPSVASAAAVDLVGTAEVGAASTPSGRRRNSKGKGGKGGGGDGGGGGGGSGGGGGVGGGGGGGGGSGGFGGGGGGGGGSGSGGGGSGSGGGGGGGSGAGQGGAAQRGGFGGSQRQQQPRSRETLSAQQLCEWYAGRGRSGGVGPCTYFPDVVELPRWGDLLKQNVAIFDLDFDAILAAMYAVTDSAEGDCYLCVPPDPGIEADALGASVSAVPGTSEAVAPGAGESALSSTAPTEALHTFTLDFGASCSFFRDSTILTPLSRPVAVSLGDSSGGPVLAHSWPSPSTVLPCSVAPLGLLSVLHLPSYSTSLVSGADLQDLWVDQFTPGGQRVTHCTCSRTGRNLATFTCRPGSSLYTLSTASPSVPASGEVASSGQVFAAASRSSPASAPCSCHPLAHETLLWHHRLGHPSLPRLRGMASCTIVSGLPRSLPPLPPGPAPTCVPCVEGRQGAAPHSSEFPPTEAPPQTLVKHMCGQERYFLLVVDDYSRYTTVFPLRRNGEVTEVLIDWIRGARRQVSESFGSDLACALRQRWPVVEEAVEEVEEVEVVVGVVPGVGASVAAVEAVEAVDEEVEVAAAVVEVAEEVVLVALREWYAGRGRSGGAGPCTYVLLTGTRSGEVCGLPHTTQRCFGRLTDAWRTQFPDAVELPRWHDLLLQNVPILDLDFDAILAAMYALAHITEGDCYLRVPPNPHNVAAALGASAAAALGASASAAPGAGPSPLSGTAPTESFHTFTLDSGASRSFFRDSTTLTPLSRPVAVSLADPSGGPVLAHSSTVLPCPAASSGLLSGLHLPSFSTNLVSGADLQDVWVDQFTPGGQRVTHCTCSRTGRHLATFTRRPGSSLYTLTTAPPPISASGQVAASSKVFAAASRSSPASAPCSCRPLAHETLLWHHRLGHPSLPRLRGMASRALVSGLPRSLPPLPPGPAPTCVPCVEGRQPAAPHSSSFPPTEAPLQTLHMD